MPDLHTVVRGVPVVRWDPLRPHPDGPRRVSNFGDLLGPLIIRELLGRVPVVVPDRRRLVAVGSVLHFARPGDVVWGSGVNGKMPPVALGAGDLDVRAVRGPLTRAALALAGMEPGDVIGDPALLIPELVPDLVHRAGGARTRDVTIIPNLNDRKDHRNDPRAVDPTAPLLEVLRAIAESRLVVASSLHALIVADALGVDAVPLASRAEHPFKYADHYAGTGRREVLPARTVEDALASSPPPPLSLDLMPLRRSFPLDLWDVEASHDRTRASSATPPARPRCTAAEEADRHASEETLARWLEAFGRPPEPWRFRTAAASADERA